MDSDSLDETIQRILKEGTKKEIQALRWGSQGIPILIGIDHIKSYQAGLSQWLRSRNIKIIDSTDITKPETLQGLKIYTQLRIYNRQHARAKRNGNEETERTVRQKIDLVNETLKEYAEWMAGNVDDPQARVESELFEKGKSLAYSLNLRYLRWEEEFSVKEFLLAREHIKKHEFLTYLETIGIEEDEYSGRVERWNAIDDRIESIHDSTEVITALNNEYATSRKAAQDAFLGRKFTQTLQAIDDGYFILHKLIYELTGMDKKEKDSIPKNILVRTAYHAENKLDHLSNKTRVVHLAAESSTIYYNLIIQYYKKRNDSHRVKEAKKLLQEELIAVQERDRFIYVDLGLDLDKLYAVAQAHRDELRSTYP
ncbi:MAG: hypothetical protein ABIJ21_05400 [Nanoarchaeota archaeon]